MLLIKMFYQIQKAKKNISRIIFGYEKKTERRDHSVFQTGLYFRSQDLRFRFKNLEHLLDTQTLKVSFNALIEMDSGNSKELV